MVLAVNHVPGFSYDANGDVTNDAANTYAYNVEGRPMTVNGYGQIFDAFDRLVESQNAGGYTSIVHSPDGYKLALMNGSSVVKYMAPLAAGMQAVYTANTPAGVAYWRHADWLGSSRLASTAGQTVYYDGAYAPFGESYAETGTTDRSFTGQTQDTTPGLYDFLYRQQSSAQGRWLVPDPAGLAAVDLTNPQSWNRYAYVMNNPLSGRDPLGLYTCVGADAGNEEDCYAEEGMWQAEEGDPGYVDATHPVYCFSSDGMGCMNSMIPNPTFTDTPITLPSNSDDSFAPGSLAYQTFGLPSAGIWASSSYVANFFAGATLGVVAGVAAVPAIAAAPGAAVGVGARGIGWAAGLTGGTGVVLGKFPQYVETAEALGANKFSINPALYTFLNNFGHAWTANQAFIDASVFRGQQFFLSTVGASGSYAQELEYLKSIGIGPESWQGAFLPFY
jgi:RHS repeat-associated protein